MFWELEKAIFGPEKDKWWIWGSKTPKPPEMPIKLGKTSQHHNWPRYMDWPQLGPKIAVKQGKNAKRTNGTYFARPRGGGWAWVYYAARLRDHTVNTAPKKCEILVRF